MTEFFETLSELIKQYSITAIANLFAIIECLATVVAAMGAIIAVFVAKKIANNQNIILEEQNKIAEKQAEISLKQNRIALFSVREGYYIKVLRYFNAWSCDDQKESVLYENVTNDEEIYSNLASVDRILYQHYFSGFMTRKEIVWASALYKIKNQIPRLNPELIIKMQLLFSLDDSLWDFLIKLEDATCEMEFTMIRYFEEFNSSKYSSEQFRGRYKEILQYLEFEMFSATERFRILIDNQDLKTAILSALEEQLTVADSF